MKKIITIILLLSITGAYALSPTKKRRGNEQWLDMGLRGNIGAMGLLNQNAISDSRLKYQFPLGYSGGAKLGYNYNNVSLCVEGLYTSFNQKIKGKTELDSGVTYQFQKQFQLTYIDMPILIRIKNEEKWKYFEFGVKVGFLKSAKSILTSSENPSGNEGSFDIKSTLPSNNIAAVIGWGSDLLGTKGMLISMGLRLSYGFTDLMAANKGTNQNFPFPLYNGDLSNTSKTAYKMTNIVSVGIQLNIEYDLGTFMSSSCKRSHKFVLFKH